jgi:hypothetical protein
MQLLLYFKRFSNRCWNVFFIGTFTINSSTEKIDTRARGRFANLKIENVGINENWRFGTFRADVNPDGRR